LRRIAAIRYDDNNASMSERVRQVAWVAAALVVPVALSVALLPLRYHVDDVLVAVVLLAVSAAALARAEWLPRIVAGVSAALSFNFFYARPYDQFAGGIQAIETTVVLALAIPVLAAWVGRLSGREAAREKALREQAERNAAELAERQRQVERLAADLTASRRRIVAAGDEMRRRIERNLHDGVQQRLVTLSLKLGGVRDKVPDSLPAIRDDLDQLADVLIETLDEIRDLARGVHPAILVEAGLGSALHVLAQRSAFPVRLHLHADDRMPAESEATAYYVVFEAFANAVKHARASAVDIQVDMLEGMLTVQVSDDGVGGADASCGSGLTGIRDRVEAVGDRARVIGSRVGRDQDHGRPVTAVACGQTPGKLKPALTPEHDVYQDNLRPELLGPLQCLSRGSGNTDDAHASLFQAIAGGLQEQPVAVHDQDTERRHVTSVPASAVPRIGASRNAWCRRLPAG
jgi:signal transduction histidine kinase